MQRPSLARVERITPAQAEALQKAGQAVFVDVRPSENYRISHVPGALSVPLATLRAALPTLPRDKTLIFY